MVLQAGQFRFLNLRQSRLQGLTGESGQQGFGFEHTFKGSLEVLRFLTFAGKQQVLLVSVICFADRVLIGLGIWGGFEAGRFQ